MAHNTQDLNLVDYAVWQLTLISNLDDLKDRVHMYRENLDQ